MKNKILITLLSLFVVSCGGGFTPASYNVKKFPQDQLATITVKPYKAKFFKGGTPTLIADIYTEKNERVVGNNSLVKQYRWKVAYIQQGKYRIVLDCDTQYLVSRPEILLEVYPRDAYEIECVQSGLGYKAAYKKI